MEEVAVSRDIVDVAVGDVLKAFLAHQALTNGKCRVAAKTDSGGWRPVVGIPRNAVQRKHYSQTAGRRSQVAKPCLMDLLCISP